MLFWHHISGVYNGAQKIMGNSTILKKMTEKAQQLVGSFIKNGSEEKILKRPVSNNFNSNLNV